jgi:hypothetical protein
MRHPGKVFNDLMLIILRFAKYGEGSCAAAATDDSRTAGGLSVCSFVAGFRMLQLVACCNLSSVACCVMVACCTLHTSMSEYSTGLVHCDFNEFNLLINDEEKVTVRAARPRERWSTHTLSRARVCACFRARTCTHSRARACTNTQLISSKERDDDAVPRLETIGRPCASMR